MVNVFAVSWATQRGSMTGGPGHYHAHERMKRQLEVPVVVVGNQQQRPAPG